MTIQQEAVSLINSMPEDSVTVIVELLRRMKHDSDLSDNVTQSTQRKNRRVLGLAEGKYSIPDDIDACNGEIAQMFGVG